MNTKKVRRIIREELAHELHYNNDSSSIKDVVERIESGIQSLDRDNDRRENGARLLDTAERVGAVSDFQCCVRKVHGAGEVVADISHAGIVAPPPTYYINGMSIKDLIAAANRE